MQGGFSLYLFLIDQKDSSTIDFQAMSERVAPETDLVQCLAPGTLTNIAERLKPEIIVIDFDLLDHDSVTYFRTLRDICPEAHILVLTNPDNYQNLHMVIEQGGIDEYVFKPFILNDFLARVHIVSRRKAIIPVPPAEKPEVESGLSFDSGRKFDDDEKEEKPDRYEAEMAEQTGEESEASYREEPEDLFEDNLSTLYEDKGEDLFDQPAAGGFDQEAAVSRETPEAETDTTGMLLAEDLDEIMKKTPAEQPEQGEFSSLDEDEAQDLFSAEPSQEPEKPAATDVDLFADIIAGNEADYSNWDFPTGSEKPEPELASKLDKLPEPFDSEFPDTDASHELNELDLELFAEPAVDQAPEVAASEKPAHAVPPPPDLSELKSIRSNLSGPEAPGSVQNETPFIPGKANHAGQPVSPPVSAPEPPEHTRPQEQEGFFASGDQEGTSFDQIFTDRADDHSRREEEPLSSVDEFESFFVGEEQGALNEFDLPEGEQLRPFFEEENDFISQNQKKQSTEKSSGSGKVIGTILNVFFALILVFIAVIAFFLIQDQLSDDPPTIAGYEIYVHMNDSMKPEFAAGSLILVRDIDAASIMLGDVVTFHSEVDPDEVRASRVVGVNREDGLSFVTRPDAAAVNDPAPVPEAKVIGKVTNTIPFIGHLIDYAQTREGVIMLVFIPGLLIIVYQLVKIIRYFSAREKSETAY
jgi:signal peptidase I